MTACSLARNLGFDLLRPTIPILHARDVRHPDVVTIPAVEAIHLEQPEPRSHVRQYDKPVIVANVHTERALLDARRALPAIVRIATEAVLVLALARIEMTLRLRMLGVLQIEHLQAILIRGHEHVRPSNFMVVREISPIRRPRTDGNVDVLRLPRLTGLEIPDAKRSVLVLGFGDRITTVRRWRKRVRHVHPETRYGEQRLWRLRLGHVPNGI